MVTRSLTWIFLGLAIASHAQTKPDVIRNGLLKADLAFVQSFMTRHKSSNVYLGGDLEFYASRNISIKGDCFWYLDTRQRSPVLKQNALVLFGAVMHYPIGKHDLSAGIQPGISFTQPMPDPQMERTYPVRLLPAFSISAGYTFCFSRLCNFFLSASYVTSCYRGGAAGSIRLDEIFLTGGLGFHLNTRKHPEYNR